MVSCRKKRDYWRHVIIRASSASYKEKFPTYKDVTVCDEWHNFQNFAEWFEQNYNPETMQGWHLDKDILVKGNKVYSPETCCFVPKEINFLFTNRKNQRGSYPIGVRPKGDKFQARINIFRKSKCLGVFNTPEEAFQAYKTAKELYIKEVADEWKDKITQKVYEAMYRYEIKIND